MSLPRLLRQLQQAAHGKDRRGVIAALAALRRESGWAKESAAFIARLSSSDASFVQDIVRPSPAPGVTSFSSGHSGGIRPAPLVPSGMATVTRDATSLIYTPANAAEWTTTLAVAGISTGNPSLLWLLQEASGDAADSIGTFTGTSAGAFGYQQAVTGWTRKGVTFTGGQAHTIRSTAAGLPDILTASMLVLAIAATPANTGLRTYLQMGTVFAADATLQVEAGGTNQLVADVGSVVTGTTALADGAVHPIALKVDRTGSVSAAYTDEEKLAPTVGGSGKTLLIGGDNSQTYTAATATWMYVVAFFNGAAEISDANVKVLLQTLGWTVAW